MKRNEWVISICEPPALDFVYKDKHGEEYILSMTRKLYAVSALRQAVPLFRNKPVYDSHLEPHETTNGRGDIALSGIYDPREYRGQRVGFIGRTGFSEKYRRIHAMLHVTDHTWQTSIFEAFMDDSLSKIGLSMTPRVYEGTQTLRVGEGVYFPVVSEILDVFSVDLTDIPFFGGRFLNAEPNPKWLEYAREWQRINIGDN